MIFTENIQHTDILCYLKWKKKCVYCRKSTELFGHYSWMQQVNCHHINHHTPDGSTIYIDTLLRCVTMGLSCSSTSTTTAANCPDAGTKLCCLLTEAHVCKRWNEWKLQIVFCQLSIAIAPYHPHRLISFNNWFTCEVSWCWWKRAKCVCVLGGGCSYRNSKLMPTDSDLMTRDRLKGRRSKDRESTSQVMVGTELLIKLPLRSHIIFPLPKCRGFFSPCLYVCTVSPSAWMYTVFHKKKTTI